MKGNWNYHRVIDLEHFIGRDAETPDGALHERDRQIFLELDDRDPDHLLTGWLDSRRTAEKSGNLPGALARDAFILLRTIVLGLALLFGGASGLLYFSYSGNTPVNVLPFFAIFVILQIALATIILLRQGLARLLRRAMPESTATLLLAALARKLFRSLLAKGRSTLPAQQTLALQAILGRGRTHGSRYGILFYWPLFTLLQAGGVAFNLGLLGASFIKVSVSDLAFGWQSTLQFSSQSLHEAVRLIALPWSWLFGEGRGFPTLAEVEGSRIILKDGIAHLATESLISWWPFLLLSVLVYGLLTRLCLYQYGRYRQAKAEADFTPDSPAAERIVRRMQTPLVTSQAETEPEVPSGPQPQEVKTGESLPKKALAKTEILVPDDFYNLCSMGELDKVLQRDGLALGTIHRFQVDYEGDRQLLKELAAKAEIGGLMILMEAWMPPLMDFLSFAKELRMALPERTVIRVLLLGKPNDATIFTPVADATHTRVWRQKLESLGDPYLETTTLQESA